MIRDLTFFLLLLSSVFSFSGCGLAYEVSEATEGNDTTFAPGLTDKYTSVRLNPSLDHLSDNQRQMVAILVEAADRMNELFWYEAYGQRDSLLPTVEDPETQEFIDINYGPWDRLDGNQPFISGVGPKPAGANFYPVRHDQRGI